MNKEEKKKILAFAQEGFEIFYKKNEIFLKDKNYKPGKKVYRNMSALNKMMYCYIEEKKDYIEKEKIINRRKWDGPSTYSQFERVITNFGLSDTLWNERNRSVLLLNEKGLKIKEKYVDFMEKNPSINLLEYNELPSFSRNYILNELENTTSKNMTLWKNIILTGLYLYAYLGYMPKYNNNDINSLQDREKNAFIKCCNYQTNGKLQDITYFLWVAHMLKNLKILDNEYKMKDTGYKLLKNLKIFKEYHLIFDEFEDYYEISNNISNSKITLKEEKPPEREIRNVHINSDTIIRPKNINFEAKNITNIKIGDLGERLVYEYEKRKLELAGIKNIEEKLFLTSKHKDYGNAYPVDIISYDIEKKCKIFIEVKTTKGKATDPFYISESERKFSKEHRNNYKLYRVYDVTKNKTPKLYVIEGYIKDNFTLLNENYIAIRYTIEKYENKEL